MRNTTSTSLSQIPPYPIDLLTDEIPLHMTGNTPWEYFGDLRVRSSFKMDASDSSSDSDSHSVTWPSDS